MKQDKNINFMQMMNEQDDMEFQLWEYLDDACPPESKQRIARLVATDAVWQRKYDELAALHSSIAAHIETEQPSMRFTKNVMESIAATQIARPTSLYINRNIIRGIAAFFILMVASMIIYAAFTVHASGNTIDLTPGFNIMKNTALQAFNSKVVLCILFINVLLGLLLFDGILRKKRTRQSSHHFTK